MEYRFPAMKSFGETAGTIAFNTANPHKGLKGIRSKPMVVGLGRETVHDTLYLSFALARIQWNKCIGLSQVAVVLGNFVFENQVIPEGIPGQTRYLGMILMKVITIVGENEIGIDISFDVFE